MKANRLEHCMYYVDGECGAFKMASPCPYTEENYLLCKKHLEQ